MQLDDKDPAGALWIPAEALDRESRANDREATIRLYRFISHYSILVPNVFIHGGFSSEKWCGRRYAHSIGCESLLGQLFLAFEFK
jgi:hypothetical protein